MMANLLAKLQINRRKLITRSIVAAVILVLLGIAAANLNISTLDTRTAPAPEAKASGAAKVEKGLAELPNEADFKTVAQNNILELKLDAKTGHFQVVDKRNGNVWHSYPDPAQWLDETQDGVWRTHLRSPIMFQYIDLSGNKSQPKESNFVEENGKILDVQTIPDGFKLTFDMPSKEITVPIEVKIENDSVVTRIVDSGVKEGKLSLVWIRLYPFFGAEHSVGQDGYLFIPDGSGALIRYREHNMNVNRTYQEPVYGQDIAFKINDFDFSRYKVMMPVFGAKSGEQGFLSVVEDGAEFARITASPSGVYSGYNWITAQQDYRSSYRQVTNEKKNRSFITYNKDARFGSDRTVRYILLDKGKADYVGMASRYRQYLIDNYGLTKVQPKDGKVPMTISLVGAERESGLIKDRYLRQTTTSEAMQIVQRLYGLGVDNMVVNYMGWQEDGYSSYGGLFPVDKRLGGNEGMKQFVNFAHTLDIPVYLEANYALNTTGDDGFSGRYHGMRDMGGTVIKDFVSLKWLMQKVLDRDIKSYKELGVDGVTLTNLGEYVDSDFNTKYGSPRDEARKLQQEIFKKFRDAGLNVRGNDSNFYVAPYVNAIDHMTDDYSYDLFSDEGVPFAQIALHGLIPYTSLEANERQQFKNDFLHDMEYGANPSFIFTYENSEDFKYAYELHLFSPHFTDWETAAVEEYQKFNEALGDVQNQFIVGHRTLAPKVKETTYENGKRIIVNYGLEPYTDGKITVKPQDYLVVKGGATQ